MKQLSEKRNKGYKFRIYPSNDQQILLAKTFGCVRFIFNKMLSDKISYYEETGGDLYCYPSQYKNEFPWLREVDSLALVGAQNGLKAAYNNFFRDPKIGFPKFKSKHHSRQSYTTNLVNGNIALDSGKLKPPKLGWVKVRQHREIPEGYRLKSVTVSRTSSGKYFASILYEYDAGIEQVEPNDLIGLDFSMSELYVDDSGYMPEYPKPYRTAQEKLAREQRKLSRRSKGGRNREKQRIKVARLHEHIANQRKDFLHKRSREITNVQLRCTPTLTSFATLSVFPLQLKLRKKGNSYDAVCIEDLNMKAMSQALNFGKSVSDNGWGIFTSMLAYKLSDMGKHLVKIDKWFPSSKMCSHCGAVKDELHLSERTFSCECGFTLDRDRNAAINIRNEGRRLLAGGASYDVRQRVSLPQILREDSPVYGRLNKNRGTHGDSSVNILPLGGSSQEAPTSGTVRW